MRRKERDVLSLNSVYTWRLILEVDNYDFEIRYTVFDVGDALTSMRNRARNILHINSMLKSHSALLRYTPELSNKCWF